MATEVVPQLLEKIWGIEDTRPWLENPERRRIGEIWFRTSEEGPVLVKFLFTSQNLSIQVHPGDTPQARGKTEMWHVLRADEGAQVGIGLKRQIALEELKPLALSGEIEHLLQWVPARPGDTFFIPAGTIHALGAGLVICEIQQNSDTTYRLHDFGRGRELHLDESASVAKISTSDGRTRLPVECEYFRTEEPEISGAGS